MSGWRASPSIAHRETRDKQRRCVVGKVRLSPRVGSDPGAGAGGSRLAPRKPVPEGSSTPDLGNGGGEVAYEVAPGFGDLTA